MSMISMYNKLNSLSKPEIATLKRDMFHSKELYARVCYPHVVTEVPQFHSDIYNIHDQLARGNGTYAALVLFRGAAKSTIKTISSSHDISYRLEKVSVFTSEAEDQCMRDLMTIQNEILENEILGRLYGVNKGKIWNQHEALFSNGCYLTAKGFRSRIRGIKFGHNRPSKVVADDFESELNTKTQEQREDVLNRINSALLPAGDVNYKLIFQGTIVHPDSFLANIKNEKTRPDLFKEPNGYYFERGISSDHLNIGEPTWKKRFPIDVIKAKKQYYEQINGGANMWEFWQEYYNIPRLAGAPVLNMEAIVEMDCIFKKYETFKYIKFSNGTCLPVNTFLGCDPAIALTDKSDRSIFFVMGIFPNGSYIILDIIADRMDVEKQRDTVFKLHEKYHFNGVTIETVAYQLALLQLVRSEQMRQGKFFPINKFDKKINKGNKFKEGLSVPINTRQVSYIKGCPNIGLLKEEGAGFSGGLTEHDDTLDGMYLSVIHGRKPFNIDVQKQIEEMRFVEKNVGYNESWVTL